jgi:hypothetical protein
MAAGAAAVVLSAVAASGVRADGNVPQAASGGNVAPQSSAPAASAPAPAQTQANSGPSAAPSVEPSFIYAFGQWWDNARAKLDDFVKPPDAAASDAAQAAQDAMKGAAQATRNAVDALIRLPSARFIEVHERCAAAQNGAPDCRTAAAKVCRVKGFSDGHPVNVQSSENCPPAVWMSGHPPAAGQCPQETVVLMVACD